jgi:zinc/manganese transport system substrate-binding protein
MTAAPPLTRRRWLAAAATTLPAAAFAQRAGPAPRLVASFSILGDMLREIAPPDFEVASLVGPDADAHVFEPRPADARRLAQADLVVVNGLGFEGWIERLVRASGYRGAVVVASAGIVPGAPAAAHGHGHGHAHGADPHLWQDLAHAQRYAATLAAALAQRWPARAAELQARHADYRARLARLDGDVHAWLGAVPRAQRRVIASHDAFGHFGAAYGVDFLAPRGWSTASEPSAAAVARLVRQIREQRVRALFVENISDPRLVQRLAQETGVRVGGTLYSDALSAPGGPADTYLKLFAHNARTLAAALSG